jgi:uncharacterized membrane protein (GlpM family)
VVTSTRIAGDVTPPGPKKPRIRKEPHVKTTLRSHAAEIISALRPVALYLIVEVVVVFSLLGLYYYVKSGASWLDLMLAVALGLAIWALRAVPGDDRKLALGMAMGAFFIWQVWRWDYSLYYKPVLAVVLPLALYADYRIFAYILGRGEDWSPVPRWLSQKAQGLGTIAFLALFGFIGFFGPLIFVRGIWQANDRLRDSLALLLAVVAWCFVACMGVWHYKDEKKAKALDQSHGQEFGQASLDS